METISVPSYPSKSASVTASSESPVEIQNPYLHVEPEKEVVSLVPESLSPEDVGSASTENSDMPVASPGLDYEPEGVPDNSPNLQKNPEEPNPESPHLLDVYLEEYPPYPPPPYPSGEPEGPGEDSVSMRPPEITGQVSLPPVSNVLSHGLFWSPLLGYGLLGGHILLPSLHFYFTIPLAQSGSYKCFHNAFYSI